MKQFLDLWSKAKIDMCIRKSPDTEDNIEGLQMSPDKFSQVESSQNIKIKFTIILESNKILSIYLSIYIYI